MLVVTPIYPTTDRPEAGPFVRRRVDALRAGGADVEVVSFSDYGRPGWRRYLELLARALRPRPRPDGVEGHVLLYAGMVALLAARLHRRPLLLYAHGHDVRETASRSRVHLALARRVARRADAIVTNSTATASMVARLGVSADVVPPVVDFERFRPGDQAVNRERLGLPRDARIALYVGTLSARKGADVFAAAVAQARGWLGVMVGGGDLRAALARDHPGLRLAGIIEPDEMPAWFAAADVVVVPSRDEPLGLAAVEALACGVPVIASAVGGLMDVVRNEQTGMLVRPADPGAIADALRRLEDPDLRARFRAAARASVANHDIGLSTERMAAIWRRLGVVITAPRQSDR
jgi:glycosyltransferase involved in cell wall biosynthesis